MSRKREKAVNLTAGTEEVEKSKIAAKRKRTAEIGESSRGANSTDQIDNDAGRLQRSDTELIHDDETVPAARPSRKRTLTPSIKQSESLQGDIILIQIEQLRQRFPDADPNVLYARLERAVDVVAETAVVIKELEQPASAAQNGGACNATTIDVAEEAVLAAILDESGFEFKQPMEDVIEQTKRIRESFPTASYETCFRRLANCDNMVLESQQLLDELGAMDDDQPGPSHRGLPRAISPPKLAATTSGMYNFLERREREAMEHILQMFPDCDPHFVVKEMAEKEVNADVLIDRMTRTSYPKLKDRMMNERQERRRQEFMDGTRFDIEEFLRIFPDPIQYFGQTDKAVSELYRHHAVTQLQNDFRDVDVTYLRKKLEENNHHYYPTFKALKEAMAADEEKNTGKPTRGTRRKKPVASAQSTIPHLSHPRTDLVPFPDQVDELFFRELQYASYEDFIQRYLKDKEDERRRLVEEARQKSTLQECLCCFSDEILFEEMVGCNNETVQHRFCQQCVQAHAEERIGQGRHQITCVNTECEEVFGFNVLRRILQPRLIDVLLRRSQQEEIRQAGIENMESCPFCDFSAIFDANADDNRVFRCQNPDCLKASCRLCKEPDHVPLKCNEVEKADETAMRTFIENRMAEALIRTCPKCNRRIIKESGCNKMSCPCGAFLCYICRAVLDKKNPYSHFNDTAPMRGAAKAGCPVYTQMYDVHEQVAKQAGEQAQKEYLEKHPELVEDKKKKVDVEKLIDKNAAQQPGGLRIGHHHPHGGVLRVELMDMHRAMVVRRDEALRRMDQQRMAVDRADMEMHRALLTFREAAGMPRELVQPDEPDEAMRRQRMADAVRRCREQKRIAEYRRAVEVLEARQRLLDRNVAVRRQTAAQMQRAHAQLEHEIGEERGTGATVASFPAQQPAQQQPVETKISPLEEQRRKIEETKQVIRRLNEQLTVANERLQNAQRRAMREKSSQIGGDIREAIRARDNLLSALAEAETRALHMGVSEEEIGRSKDRMLTRMDIAESVAEARRMVSAKRRWEAMAQADDSDTDEERAAQRRRLGKETVLERVVQRIPYYIQDLQKPMLNRMQVYDILGTIRREVLDLLALEGLCEAAVALARRQLDEMAGRMLEDPFSHAQLGRAVLTRMLDAAQKELDETRQNKVATETGATGQSGSAAAAEARSVEGSKRFVSFKKAVLNMQLREAARVAEMMRNADNASGVHQYPLRSATSNAGDVTTTPTGTGSSFPPPGAAAVLAVQLSAFQERDDFEIQNMNNRISALRASLRRIDGNMDELRKERERVTAQIVDSTQQLERLQQKNRQTAQDSSAVLKSSENAAGAADAGQPLMQTEKSNQEKQEKARSQAEQGSFGKRFQLILRRLSEEPEERRRVVSPVNEPSTSGLKTPQKTTSEKREKITSQAGVEPATSGGPDRERQKLLVDRVGRVWSRLNDLQKELKDEKNGNSAQNPASVKAERLLRQSARLQHRVVTAPDEERIADLTDFVGYMEQQVDALQKDAEQARMAAMATMALDILDNSTRASTSNNDTGIDTAQSQPATIPKNTQPSTVDKVKIPDVIVLSDDDSDVYKDDQVEFCGYVYPAEKEREVVTVTKSPVVGPDDKCKMVGSMSPVLDYRPVSPVFDCYFEPLDFTSNATKKESNDGAGTSRVDFRPYVEASRSVFETHPMHRMMTSDQLLFDMPPTQYGRLPENAYWPHPTFAVPRQQQQQQQMQQVASSQTPNFLQINVNVQQPANFAVNVQRQEEPDSASWALLDDGDSD